MKERPARLESPASLWANLRTLAREKRREPTSAEDAMWQMLRLMRPGGMKFRRQHAIGPYIVDFYCVRAQLVIEVDGSSHDGRVEEDTARQTDLEALGLTVLRFTNERVLNNPLEVVRRIEACAPAT